MTQKRSLDVNDLKARREAGQTWQQIANDLKWNLSALRDRLRRDNIEIDDGGAGGSFEKSSQKTDNIDNIEIDWQRVEDLIKVGCTLEDVAGSFGFSRDYLAQRYIKSQYAKYNNIEIFYYSCRALGRCELQTALFNMATNAEKAALPLIKEALKDD